jgi:S-adenosyl-L-methionine hydrolase (adenosine-forming)
MSAPIITLTTDFGTRDPWVGIMKGVMLDICPEACLVDISHDIAPQDVLEGALCLEAAAGFFPTGTIHLAVVDPGVGSARRPLAIRAGGQCYVGPDNGLLSLVLDADARPIEAVELTSQEYRRSATSRTFHGRDIFAPAAAHLASRVPLERLGPPVTDPVRLVVPSSRHGDGLVLGEVIAADRFGNLLTSVTERDVAAFESPHALIVEIGGVRVGALVSAYSDVRPGEMGAVVSSTGRLEVFVREGSAQATLGLGRGAPVVVKRS